MSRYQDCSPVTAQEEELRRIEHICRETYLLTGCRDYARIDLRITDGVLYVLDVNPDADICPDINAESLAEFAGYK